jgi:hypothetical protein
MIDPNTEDDDLDGRLRAIKPTLLQEPVGLDDGQIVMGIPIDQR